MCALEMWNAGSKTLLSSLASAMFPVRKACRLPNQNKFVGASFKKIPLRYVNLLLNFLSN
jgi:hypothetical protein